MQVYRSSLGTVHDMDTGIEILLGKENCLIQGYRLDQVLQNTDGDRDTGLTTYVHNVARYRDMDCARYIILLETGVQASPDLQHGGDRVPGHVRYRTLPDAGIQVTPGKDTGIQPHRSQNTSKYREQVSPVPEHGKI